MDPKKPTDDHNDLVPARNRGSQSAPLARDAAAQLMRQQIDQLYSQQDAQEQAEKPVSDNSPYHRTHSETAAHKGFDAEHWKNYH